MVGEIKMGFLLCCFYFIYVAMALSPLIIIFILKNNFNEAIAIPNILCVLCIMILAYMLSYLYIFCIKKHNKDVQNEQMECSEIEIAEPKYIPIYIAYFVISLSINKLIVFCLIFALIYLLVLKGKFSYFNPYLLFSYHFYEISINTNQKCAKYKVFLISKQKIKNITTCNNLIRLNDFTFLDRSEQ